MLHIICHKNLPTVRQALSHKIALKLFVVFCACLTVGRLWCIGGKIASSFAFFTPNYDNTNNLTPTT